MCIFIVTANLWMKHLEVLFLCQGENTVIWTQNVGEGAWEPRDGGREGGCSSYLLGVKILGFGTP